MTDFRILRFLDKLKPIFEKLGADYTVMRKILQIKLLLDGRRTPTIFAGSKMKASQYSNKFLKSLWLYVLFGVILIPFVIMKNNYIYQMGFVFAIVMFFIMTSLISDFSSVLLDIKDKNIIGTKPIGPITIRLAKTIHIFIYMFCMTFALVGPALLVSLFAQGIIFFLTFLLSLILLDMFCIILTSLVYFMVLRFFDGEKLKDIINYVQIILSLAIMVGYQLIGRLFDIVDLKIEFIPRWWQYFIAPIWFSAPFQMIKSAEVNSRYVIFSAMAVVVPILSIVIYIKLIPLFENNLQKLSNSYGNAKKAKGKSVQLLSKILCRSKEEGIFYRFAFDMMRNEREFKLKVYPTLGYAIVIPFILMFQLLTHSGIKEISQGKSYLFMYFCGMLLPTVILMIGNSERYKGAWIYKALPIRNVMPIFKGTIKAFITKLFFPMFLFEAIIFTIIFGIRIVPDLLMMFLNMMIFIIFCFMAMDKILPFSKSFEAIQKANTGNILLLLIVLAIMAGIHYALTYISFGIYLYVILAFIINMILWKVAFNITPNKLNKEY